MAISFDNALGIHPQALKFRAERAAVLANNIANADTPGFKSRDISFADALDQKMQLKSPATFGSSPALESQGSGQRLNMHTTSAGHLAGNSLPQGSAELMYRTPSQPSVDGNTVDTQEEIARYTENSMAFQSSFTFLNGKFKSLSAAIRGQ